ncbi:hypothetical protein [Desulfosporosinus sp. BICA1-9]|uniref:anti-sigma-I factor RsgI family protein n=1 Tax=Desulfosporosinus sp. BICA1-9 TaxID=1531958 RepID=UPI0005F26691|nr:hypothetical protein [Desulfosporosinus sp. BICA1-9]KJS50793.1 MAG: hypothetical protein VR66_00825 [Peptococcaceae bacterium BRH_c23]KJS89545.1 MAG: hypothetical protein JL57_06755 [Desulfosporosinus sp. BICA1-9]HBW37003.1 hypothetical protein [Desulfosporosinus sp.]
MSKMKAVVLEKSGTHYRVLVMDGTFRQVKRRLNAEVGEEIELDIGRDWFGGLSAWAGIVALFLMVLTSLIGWNLYQAPTAVALVSVDINPSLQFTLDSQGRLLKFKTQNEDARQMLGENDFKGKPIDEVLEKIVTLAYNQNYINPEQQWIVVGYSPLTNKSTEKMPKELNEIQISDWITEAIEKNGLTPQVAVFTLSPEDGELAQKEDLTIGEFALWQTAQKAGVTTQPQKLKETSERVRILENPQVQALVKAEQKGIKNGLPIKPGTTTENQRALVNPFDNNLGKQKPNASPSSVDKPNPLTKKDREPETEKGEPTVKESRNNNNNDKNNDENDKRNNDNRKNNAKDLANENEKDIQNDKNKGKENNR